MADYKLWNALKDAKKYRWVELSHSLNNESPYWSGIPEGSVELAKTVWDWGKPELECLIQTFKFPGQFGTHIDFPGHFIKGKALSEKYDVNDLIFPLVVIDISEQAKKDPRYAVTVEDIKAYEAKYGPIPDGALVALRSDWYKKWPDMDALSGIDAEGKENAPGWSLEALEYIYKVRNAAANGHETLDTDSSAVAEEKGDLACERYVLDNDKLQVEVLANLDKVQPAGAVVVVSYPRIEGATGLPARVWALPNKSGEVGKCPLKKQRQTCWSRSLPCKNGTPERPQMLRRIERIDIPARRRLLHKYCAAASFFSSDESAKAQPAAQQEEEQHFTQHRQP